MDPSVFAVVSQMESDHSDSPRTATTMPASLAGYASRTVLSISGAGRLLCAYWYHGDSYQYATLSVSVDGGAYRQIGQPPDIVPGLTSTTTAGVVLDVRFKSSLTVKVVNGYSSASSVGTSITYSLDA